MTLCPDPVLAERLLRRWCPVGTAVRIEGSRRAGGAVHLRVDVEGIPVPLPIGVQVADLFGRELDRDGRVRLQPRETVRQLVAALALRLHGDGRALGVQPAAVTIHTPARRRLLSLI